MQNFDAAFERLLGHEGGYSNNPADPGGETMYGITKRVAVANGYTGPMRDLPLAEAKRIAKAAYWDAVKGDAMPNELDFQLFDTAYNSGPAQAVKLLQRALDVPADGILGPNTLGQIAKAQHLGSVAALLARFNGQRLEFLTSLYPWPNFGKGWARRVAENLKRVQ